MDPLQGIPTDSLKFVLVGRQIPTGGVVRWNGMTPGEYRKPCVPGHSVIGTPSADSSNRVKCPTGDGRYGPSLPLLAPPCQAPPEILPLSAGKDSSVRAPNQQGSRRDIGRHSVVLSRLLTREKKICKTSNENANRRHCPSLHPRSRIPWPLSGRPVALDNPLILRILNMDTNFRFRCDIPHT